ncbi:hypothetical protein [Mycoplasma feriruminatoris]|uniref:Helix-turn-helix domain-containing protein n=1 Tax=Mycoplasma feriruminatoris TaxID=1179777 RepID=A0AAQ3HWZ9_9MOLU|nr:hypothetical protein [Mycoplasma feriruminatoris]WFQ95592.1 helix-turn-helix domain-containing protein [Mycoplasma feriruminatoris]
MKDSNKKTIKPNNSKTKYNEEKKWIKELEKESEYYKLEAEFWKKFHTLLTENEEENKK